MKHAIAKARPSRISSELRSKEPLGPFWNVCLTLTAASGGATVTLDRTEVFSGARAFLCRAVLGLGLAAGGTLSFTRTTGAVERGRAAGGL